jgi:Cd(II)/Pb(II)-responsive transcriptional regulator
MKIGELASLTGVLPETIRYYEQEELLMAPARSLANYRVYGREHVDRLNLIRQCRSLDMTLEEIRSLLKFQNSPNENCDKVDLLLDTQIEKIEQRIERMLTLKSQLISLRALCNDKQAVRDCKIMRELTCCDGSGKPLSVEM